MSQPDLNEMTWELVQKRLGSAAFPDWRVESVAGATVVDAGVIHSGGLDAGRLLADACLAGQGKVSVSLERLGEMLCPRVTVETSQPLLACLASQYAGWALSVGSYFAMASGPGRLLVGKEPMLAQLGLPTSSAPEGTASTARKGVVVLETSKLPDDRVIAAMVEATGCPAAGLLVLAARTASVAGSLQVVARSVETCLHKLHELKFDVRSIRSAIGSAWLPPIPKSDIEAIGRTNDSILYGGEVCLWVDSDDAAVDAIANQLPACASADYGEPFAAIFSRYGGDFYKIDPMLFSPALVRIDNLRSGRVIQVGRRDDRLLLQSFFGNQG